MNPFTELPKKDLGQTYSQTLDIQNHFQDSLSSLSPINNPETLSTKNIQSLTSTLEEEKVSDTYLTTPLSYYETDVPEIPSQHLITDLTQQAPELLDVLKEVAHLVKLRERIEVHNDQRSATEAKSAARRVRQKVAKRFEGGFRAYEDFEVLQFIEEKVIECYPIENFNLDMAKELRSISKEVAALYERYQKIIKGTSLFIEFDSDQFERLLGIILECCPPEIQLRIADALDKYAVKAGGTKTVKM